MFDRDLNTPILYVTSLMDADLSIVLFGKIDLILLTKFDWP